MKNIFIPFLIFSFCFNINAQDIITLKNSKVIHAYITEKSDTKIKYRTDSISNVDSTYNMKLGQIRTIQYGNGDVGLLSSQNPRSVFPLGVGVGADLMFFSLFFFNGNIDYLFTPNISAELNFRYVPFTYYKQYLFSFGGEYWFAKKYGKSGFSPFVGLFLTQWRAKNDYEDVK